MAKRMNGRDHRDRNIPAGIIAGVIGGLAGTVAMIAAGGAALLWGALRWRDA